MFEMKIRVYIRITLFLLSVSFHMPFIIQNVLKVCVFTLLRAYQNKIVLFIQVTLLTDM